MSRISFNKCSYDLKVIDNSWKNTYKENSDILFI